MKLQTLKPRLQAASLSRIKALDTKAGATERIRGRKLQERRLRIWSQSPYCAMCKKLVSLEYPHRDAFELDHIEPLKADGGNGEDTEDNCQVLCVGPNGCHAKKTAKDMGFKFKQMIGLDGWPIEE